MADQSFSNKKSQNSAAPTQDTSSSASTTPASRGILSDLVAPLGVAFLLAFSGTEKAQGAPAQGKPQTTHPSAPLTHRAADVREQKMSLYRVEKGDTLSSIAKRFNVTVEYLTATNPDVEAKSMSIGQILRLPVRPAFHIVKKGESPTRIAAQYGISVKDLLGANPQVKDSRTIQIGQQLHLPSPTKVQLPPAPQVSPVPAASTAALTPTPQATASAPQKAPPSSNLAANTKLSPQEAPSFFTYIKQVLGYEGMKISRDPHDIGNKGIADLTNAGVTGVAVAQHIKVTEKREASPTEVKNILEKLSLDEAIVIYSTGFWQKEYQRVPEKLAFMMFDWGVNSHPRKVIGRFQEHLNLKKTGTLDEPTIKAINALGEAKACQEFLACRLQFYRKRAQENPTQARYLGGWERRAKEALDFASSDEFKNLKGVFEKTAHRGCDFFDPVREGLISLKRGSNEAALIRHLQEKLGSVGYKVTVDGVWADEMDRSVAFFKEKHGLPAAKQNNGRPVGVTWGVHETQVLDAKVVALQQQKSPTPEAPLLAASLDSLVLPRR